MADAVLALVALLVTVNVEAPEPLYVVEPDKPVPDTFMVKVFKLLPRATPEMVLLANLALAIEPANMVLVTVLESPVVTTVPVVAGNVMVVVPAAALANTVVAPLVLPLNATPAPPMLLLVSVKVLLAVATVTPSMVTVPAALRAIVVSVA